VSTRLAVAADLSAIIDLWAEAARQGTADVPDEADITTKVHFRSPVMHVAVCELGGRIEGAAAYTRFVAGTGEIIVRVDPFIAFEPSVVRELCDWVVAYQAITGELNLIDVWVVCSAQETLSDLGFELAGSYLRLDRPSLDNITPAALPSDVTIIGLNDPRANLAEWAALYNAAFLDEWRFYPLSANILWSFLAGTGGHSIAAIDAAGKPVALAITRLQTYKHDSLSQPVGNVLVLCTSPDRMRSGIGEGILTTALVRLREAGALSATIRADEGSKYQSYILYERVGFRRSRDICIWSRRLRE
jgi:hypothetical protein